MLRFGKGGAISTARAWPRPMSAAQRRCCWRAIRNSFGSRARSSGSCAKRRPISAGRKASREMDYLTCLELFKAFEEVSMIFSLDVRRARKGDCLILHFGTKQEPGLVLIDGGPKSVYAPHLKPRLLQIRKARKLGKNDPLPVDVLMVSHVDDDHIQGILDFTREEIANVEAHGPRLLNVSSLWHNSFDEIIGSEPKMVTAKVTGTFKTEASTSEVTLSDDKVGAVEDIFLDQNAGGNDEEGKELVGSTLKVLASISQGFRLRKDAERLGYERNLEFDKALIVAMEGQETPTIAGSLKATIVGPMRDEILALHKKHQEWLEQLKAQGKTPEEALAAYVDKSLPNLSSIVVLMEAAGKKILLTGDARGDKVLEGLQLVRR